MFHQVLNKKFTYAWCLIHLKTRDDMLTGISLLKELAEHKAIQREALYYLAMAQYKLEHHEEARLSLKHLLAFDPGNRPALDLKAQIEHGRSALNADPTPSTQSGMRGGDFRRRG